MILEISSFLIILTYCSTICNCGDVSMQVNNDMIDYRMDYFGYQTYQNDDSNSEHYLECINILKNTDFKKYHPKVGRVKVEQLKKQVYENMKILFSDINLDVKYLDSKIFNACCFLDNKRMVLEKIANTINVFDVPVIYNKASARCCFNIPKDMFDVPITINCILLTKEDTEISYIHEIGHALVSRKKGIIENYLNSELIPIVMEFLYAYHHYGDKAVNRAIFQRLENMKFLLENSFYEEYLRDSYLVSGLLAIELFDRYRYSSLGKQQSILEQIKSVLIKEKVLEQFLDENHLSLDEKDVVKALKKTLELI